MKNHKEAHRANYEILTNRSANDEDIDACALNGMFGHEVILPDGDGEQLLLRKLNPNFILKDRFSGLEDVRLRQVQNTVSSLLFSLAPAHLIKGRQLILPGGYVEGHHASVAESQNDKRHWLPAPQLLRPRNDGADRIRALVGIAKYAVALLKTYSEAELKVVAAETDRWPCSVPAEPEFAKFCEEFSEWAEKNQLAKNRPLDLRRKMLDTLRNKVVFHEVCSIHHYIVDPEGWDRGRDWYIDKETGEMWNQPTKWQEQADKLTPLTAKTWKSWRDVIWAKLNEERNGDVHLTPRFRSLPDLTEIGLEGARARVREEWLKRQGLNRKIGPEERASVADNAEQLQAQNGIWIGKMARRFNVVGQPINKSAARGRIRRQLELALQHLVK